VQHEIRFAQVGTQTLGKSAGASGDVGISENDRQETQDYRSILLSTPARADHSPQASVHALSRCPSRIFI
jgi:hypothetical protein